MQTQIKEEIIRQFPLRLQTFAHELISQRRQAIRHISQRRQAGNTIRISTKQMDDWENLCQHLEFMLAGKTNPVELARLLINNILIFEKLRIKKYHKTGTRLRELLDLAKQIIYY